MKEDERVSDRQPYPIFLYEPELEEFRAHTRKIWRDELKVLGVGTFICTFSKDADKLGIAWSNRSNWRRLESDEPSTILDEIISTLYICEELDDYDLGRYDQWQTTMTPGPHALIIGVSVRKALKR